MRNLALLPALSLAGCAMQPPPNIIADPNLPGTGGVCRDAGLDAFRGRVATAELGAEMLRVSGARMLRYVMPGMVVTLEFSPERLTVQLGAGNVVERATCG